MKSSPTKTPEKKRRTGDESPRGGSESDQDPGSTELTTDAASGGEETERTIECDYCGDDTHEYPDCSRRESDRKEDNVAWRIWKGIGREEQPDAEWDPSKASVWSITRDNLERQILSRNKIH